MRSAWQWLEVGVRLLGHGDLAAAKAAFRQALETGAWAEAAYNLGWVLDAQGRYAEAAAVLRQAVELDPWWEDAAVNLRRAEMLAGQPNGVGA